MIYENNRCLTSVSNYFFKTGIDDRKNAKVKIIRYTNLVSRSSLDKMEKCR